MATEMPQDEDPITDVVGWARRTPLRRADRMSPDRGRTVIAAALGVPADALASMSDKQTTVALDRLRALVHQYEELAATAQTDDLTGALRRGAGLAALQHELDRTRRHAGAALAVVFIDVDGLKGINDHLGHAAGDELLTGVVSATKERLRSYDLVARYGGDEFFCILPGVDEEHIERLAITLKAHVDSRATTSVSIGTAVYTSDDTATSLVARADADLYMRRAQSSLVHRR